jgi:ribosomal protein L11 methyltransferase
MYGELVDDSILHADKTKAKISIFVPEEKNLSEYVTFIDAKLESLSIPFEKNIEGMEEENWADSWKKYFKPIKLGRVTIVPAWENYECAENEVIIKIDPGMAFGTGTHETTRLVMKIMQDVVRGGERVLDVGCGSGILAITASKLGAKSCNAYDIDPVAVKVAAENAEMNNMSDKVSFIKGDLCDKIDGKFDIVCANIVADVIIMLTEGIDNFMKDDALFICSGIIDIRANDVVNALEKNGFEIIKTCTKDNWCAYVTRKVK